MAAVWYYKRMGEVVGPFTAEQLKAKAAARDFAPEDLVRKGESGKWVAAFQVKGLFTSPPKPPPPPEPPPPPDPPPPSDPPLEEDQPNPYKPPEAVRAEVIEPTPTQVVVPQPRVSGFGLGLGAGTGIILGLLAVPVLLCGGCLVLLELIPRDVASWRPSSSSQQDASPEYTITNIDSRVTETNNVWWRYAWILTVKNHTNRDLSFLAARISFLDADGFIVDSVTEWGLVVPAGQEATFRGDTLINMPGARSVTQIGAELN